MAKDFIIQVRVEEHPLVEWLDQFCEPRSKVIRYILWRAREKAGDCKSLYDLSQAL